MSFSLLWPNDREESVLDKTLFGDLKITKVLEGCLDNDGDVDEMLEIMKKVPSEKTLLYRQGIFEDILADEAGVFENLYYRLIDVVHRFVSLREAAENIKRKVFLIMYLHHYYLFLETVAGTLSDMNVRSYGLRNLIETIKDILSDPETIEERKEADSFYNHITSCFVFNAEYHDGAPYYRLAFGSRSNLEDDLVAIAKGMKIDLVKKPRQFMKKEVNPYFLREISLSDPVFYEKMQDFYERKRTEITDLGYLVPEFKYLLGLKTVFSKMKEKKIPYCRVDINSENNTVIEDAYDISLAVRNIKVIPNSYRAEGRETIAFVLGVNSGGKTCYLRSVGSNFVFFMTCGYMFAEKALVRPVRYIFTHFPNEENYAFGEGRLGDEIRRMKKIEEKFGPDCIAFLNETFSSTSEDKACVLTKELLKSIGDTGTKVMYVTHQYKIFEETHDDRIGFYTPAVEEGKENIRTYKIKKVDRKLLSYVDDILYKYGLTKVQLSERRQTNG